MPESIHLLLSNLLAFLCTQCHRQNWTITCTAWPCTVAGNYLCQLRPWTQPLAREPYDISNDVTGFLYTEWVLDVCVYRWLIKVIIGFVPITQNVCYSKHTMTILTTNLYPGTTCFCKTILGWLSIQRLHLKIGEGDTVHLTLRLSLYSCCCKGVKWYTA